MALSEAHKDRELRIHESLDELSTDLADYIAELSEASVKERGVFAIALSGGSLISLMGYQCLPLSNLVSFKLLFWCFRLNLRCKTENSAKLLITRL